MMKALWRTVLIAFLLSAPIPPAQASPTSDEMYQAANLVIGVYNKAGITGTVSVVRDCYRKLTYRSQFCFYLDTAGRYIDYSATSALGRPMNAFYADGQFGKRASIFFKTAFPRMPIQKRNEYLVAVWNAMGLLVSQ